MWWFWGWVSNERGRKKVHCVTSSVLSLEHSVMRVYSPNPNLSGQDNKPADCVVWIVMENSQIRKRVSAHMKYFLYGHHLGHQRLATGYYNTWVSHSEPGGKPPHYLFPSPEMWRLTSCTQILWIINQWYNHLYSNPGGFCGCKGVLGKIIELNKKKKNQYNVIIKVHAHRNSFNNLSVSWK